MSRRQDTSDDLPPCPQCGGPMTVRSSARGTFLSCAAFPTCTGARDVFDATAKQASQAKPASSSRSARDAQGSVPTPSAEPAGTSDTRRPPRFGRVTAQSPSRIGIVRQITDESCQLAFVDVPGVHEHLEWYPRGDLRRVGLSPGTFVWVSAGGFGFLPGFVVARREEGTYLVRLHLGGREQDLDVDETRITVRDGSEFTDPVAALSVGLVDHSQSYRARRLAHSDFVHQRTACRGLTAALSAAVIPYRHQLNVLAQVINDPVRRYVLADEGGLGKTIEAGLIIRQILTDDPAARAFISVPSTLLTQWRTELEEKLLLTGSLRSRWEVVAHDDLSLAALQKYELVVIDEAHRVAERALNDESEAVITESIAERTPGLLLLTATPLRGNAEVFHYLLHLVDPVAHPKNDIDAFRSRLELREQLAMSIELLVDAAIPWELVTSTLEEFSELFPQDPHLRTLVTNALAEDPSGPRANTMAAAEYLRETYRLSRRVIRNRRKNVPEFPTTGREFETLAVSDPATPVIDEFLEDWRTVVGVRSDGSARFALTLDAAFAGPTALLDFLHSSCMADASDDERFAINNLSVRLEEVGTTSKFEQVADWFYDQWSKSSDFFVIASTSTEAARTMAEKLGERIGSKSVHVHLQSDVTSRRAQELQELLQARGFRVLVTDQSGEEGLNLQQADVLVHLDTPLSANRLEQRIARIDRYALRPRGSKKRNITVQTDSPWEVARDALHEGLGIHHTSVATLQRPLAELESELRDHLLSDGISALLDAQVGLSERMREEGEEIELLEELETISGRGDFSAEDLENIETLEENWGEIQRAFDNLTHRDFGLFLLRKGVPNSPGIFEYTAPGRNLLPKIPRDRLEALAPLLKGPRSFNRAIVVRHPGTLLMRVGDPTVDWLESYLHTDERGRARAIARHAPNISEDQLWFEVSALLETSVASSEGGAPWISRTVRRIGDGYLPPQLLTVWSDGSGPADEEFEARFLSEVPEGSSGDRSIVADHWDRVFSHVQDFSDRVHAAADDVRTRILESERTRQAIAKAISDLEADFDRRLGILERVRATSAWRTDQVNDELSRLEVLREALRSGIAQPSLRFVAIGAYFLSEER